MKVARRYVQTTRAESAEATRVRIMTAFMDLVFERSSVNVPLADVADRAGVTVQTILRRFGTRDRLFDETLEFGRAVVVAEREAPAGDGSAALAALMEHYETRGDGVLALLANEASHPKIRQIVEEGRREHRGWVDDAFGPLLDGLPSAERAERTRLLVVATDVYAWKLLRRDMALSRSATERHVRRLVDAVLTSPPPHE